MVTPSTKHKAMKVQDMLVCPLCGKNLEWESGLKYKCKCGARFLHDLDAGELLRLSNVGGRRC